MVYVFKNIVSIIRVLGRFPFVKSGVFPDCPLARLQIWNWFLKAYVISVEYHGPGKALRIILKIFFSY